MSRPYSKQYRAWIKGKLREAAEFYKHDNDVKDGELIRDALKFYLEAKGFFSRKPKPTTQQP